MGRTGSKVGRDDAAQVLRRDLPARDLGLPDLPRLIDAVEDGAGLVRAFFGQGASVAAILPDGAAGCALPTDLRAISGAVMAVLSGPGPLALAGGGRLDVAPLRDEQALFAGRDCILSFRIAEGAAQVADALVWHATQHGATGAVIVDRAEQDDFAGPLAEALGTRAPGLRVVVLRSALPLGQPGGLPDTHPISAPDAPGKDRMARPAPDPWTAPLAEGIVVEAVKWRFLAQARAVLALDACDILAPRDAGAPSAFDLAATARRGVVTLTGRRIYPWRIRPGQVAGFGDHICLPFDAARDMARWGVAPQKAGLDATWRVQRVSYAKPDADAGPLRFLRAMAVKVPGAAQPLAPKSALIEDPGLLALAQTHFGARPVRPPVTALRAGPVTGAAGDRVAIVTTMKNEGPFILEWLAYHRAIGVHDFLIYTNDCTDGTDTMLDLLQRKGLVQHRDNPFRASGLKPQHAALQAAEDEEMMRASGWGICMDVDEFINIKLGDGRLPTLFAAMEDALPGANMIALTWRLFGNAEVAEYHDRFITEQFTRCAPELIRKPHQAWGFKTLFRNISIYRKLGVHRPKGLNPDLWDQVRWLNGSGQPLPRAMFRNGWRSTTETYGYDWVSLNHYAVRSAESFLVKRDRGRVNHVDRDQGLNYWFRMNHNVDEDRSILPRLPAAQAEFARLMADPEIAAAHMASVTAHRAKIADLRATENYARFFDELTGERMRRLCRLQKHFGSAVFNAGPGVIPPDLHDRDLPPDFFFTVDAVDEAVH